MTSSTDASTLKITIPFENASRSPWFMNWRGRNRSRARIDDRRGKSANVRSASESRATCSRRLAVRSDAGVCAIIYTDIARDGVLKGLNIEATLALAEAVSVPVIASGGLASIEDVKRLLEPDCARLAGAIAGRALYDGRLNANEAIAMIKAAKPHA